MAVLVYDGDCGICTRWAGWVDRECEGVDVVDHASHGLASIERVLWIDGTRRAEGAAAVSAVLARSRRRRHRALGRIASARGIDVVAGIVYGVVARHRSRLSRWFGEPACAIGARPGVSGSRDSGEASVGGATTDERA